MPHVIEPFIGEGDAGEYLRNLREAHRYVVSRTSATLDGLRVDEIQFGVAYKRASVRLDVGAVPRLIGKTNEKITELINLAATVERLMDAVEWFHTQAEYGNLVIQECHPTTSDEEDGNDLVLQRNGQVVIRCEVCDVASSNAGQNGKENSDLGRLGCSNGVPVDGVSRFICTAPEFAYALSRATRSWRTKAYRYQLIETGAPSRTCMLLIEPPPAHGGPAGLQS
jgi:hypothetical protein